jgi:hypothetical protein
VIVHDAASAFLAVIHAALLWVQVAAGAAAMLLCAVPLLLPPAARAVQRRVTRPVWARKRFGARWYARRRVRGAQARTAPLPPWAHTDHHRYEEAA